MALGKSLTVGDTVHFLTARYPAPVAAIVTGIHPSGESRRVSLVCFPPSGHSSFIATGVEHVSLGREGDAWDFKEAGSSVEL